MAFQPSVPKFNNYSEYVMERCEEALLPHQGEALRALQQWFGPGSATVDDVALVSMPTGSGKTGIICCLPYFIGGIRNQGNYFYNMDKPVLVIAPDRTIANQHERQMSNTCLDDGENFLKERGIVQECAIRDVIPSVLTVESTAQLVQPHHLNTKDIVIANAQKFLSAERNGRWEADLRDDLFQLVVVDEAHHHPAPTWFRIMQKFSPHAKVFFFTATPFRADGTEVVQGFKSYAYELRRDRAIDLAIIRRTQFIEENELPNNAEELFQGILQTSKSKSKSKFKELGYLVPSFTQILIRARDLQLQKIKETPLPDHVPHMIMAITKENKEADLLLEIWRKIYPDDQAEVYHSKIKGYRLKETMKRLKNNELKLVIICNMLLEGFDHPPISIAAVACRIGSLVRFSQFVGRAQRVCRSQGEIEINGIAHVVTHHYFNQAANYKKYESEKFAEI